MEEWSASGKIRLMRLEGEYAASAFVFHVGPEDYSGPHFMISEIRDDPEHLALEFLVADPWPEGRVVVDHDGAFHQCDMWFDGTWFVAEIDGQRVFETDNLEYPEYQVLKKHPRVVRMRLSCPQQQWTTYVRAGADDISVSEIIATSFEGTELDPLWHHNDRGTPGSGEPWTRVSQDEEMIVEAWVPAAEGMPSEVCRITILAYQLRSDCAQLEAEGEGREVVYVAPYVNEAGRRSYALMYRRSVDGGESYSEPYDLVGRFHKGDRRWSAHGPNLFLLPDGRRLLIYGVHPNPPLDDVQTRWQIFTPFGEWVKNGMAVEGYGFPTAVYLPELGEALCVVFKREEGKFNVGSIWLMRGRFDPFLEMFFWDEPQEIVPGGARAGHQHLRMDPDGTLRLIYVNTSHEMVELKSTDYGETWS